MPADSLDPANRGREQAIIGKAINLLSGNGRPRPKITAALSSVAARFGQRGASSQKRPLSPGHSALVSASYCSVTLACGAAR